MGLLLRKVLNSCLSRLCVNTFLTNRGPLKDKVFCSRTSCLLWINILESYYRFTMGQCKQPQPLIALHASFHDKITASWAWILCSVLPCWGMQWTLSAPKPEQSDLPASATAFETMCWLGGGKKQWVQILSGIFSFLPTPWSYVVSLESSVVCAKSTGRSADGPF